MERVGHLNNSQQLLSQLVKFKALKAIREACGGDRKLGSGESERKLAQGSHCNR